MEVKILKKHFSVPKELRDKVDAIMSELIETSARYIPDEARYHVGGDKAELLSSVGRPYYEKRSKTKDKEKIPVEYLLLTDELYNKLKENKTNEVARYSFYQGVILKDDVPEGYFALPDKNDEMLGAALDVLECQDEIQSLATNNEYIIIDLDKDILEQVIKVWGVDYILDLDVANLTIISFDLKLALIHEKCEEIRDIINLSEKDILPSKHFNAKLAKELKSFLTKFNLNLKVEKHVL